MKHAYTDILCVMGMAMDHLNRNKSLLFIYVLSCSCQYIFSKHLNASAMALRISWHICTIYTLLSSLHTVSNKFPTYQFPIAPGQVSWHSSVKAALYTGWKSAGSTGKCNTDNKHSSCIWQWLWTDGHAQHILWPATILIGHKIIIMAEVSFAL